MSKRTLGNDTMQGNAAKFERSVARTGQRGYSAPGYFRMKGHDRLSGGADFKPKSAVTGTNTNVEATPNENPEALASDTVATEAEKEIDAILAESNDQESTGDKKVDEMIAYVLQNLQEAGKALASLDDNFEHDLKLTLVDIMGKVQNWVSLSRIRIDAAKNDLKNLKKDLISRSKELAAKDQEIAVAKQILIESGFPEESLQKILIERSQKNVGPLSSPSAMSFKPMGQASMPIGITSAPSGQYRQQFGPGSQQQFGPGGQRQFGPGDQPQFGIESAQQIAIGIQTARDEVTTDVAVQSGKGKDKTREAELESELARLHKELETIMKERADYENAIQRALLRGVSSLNTETLKVLRCPPPVSYYAPCGPPCSPGNAGENMSICVPSISEEKKAAGSYKKQMIVCPRRGASKICVSENYSQENHGCRSAKKPMTSACSSRYRKSSGHESHGLTFILQQANPPPACTAPCNNNNNNSHSRSWNRAKSEKVEVSKCVRNLE